MENQFIFTRPLTYELKDNGDLIVSLDISTTEPDLVNDIVTLNFLKSMQKQILEQNKKLDIEHESFRGKSVEEKEINKTRIPAGRMLEPVISEYKNEKNETHHRLNIKGIINKFRADFENIKGNILEKFLDAGSIAFIPTKFRKEEKSGIVYRFLEDGVLLNTALTGNPINTTAQMRSIISKSIDSLEEYQKAKEADPSIEGMLEVKSAASDKRKEEQAGEKEEEDNKKEKEGENEEETKKQCKDEKGGPGSGPRPGQSKRQHELSERVVDEWNRSKRTDSDVDKYNERMAKVRRGQDPFEEKDHNHLSDNTIKLQEVKKNMEEDKTENPEEVVPEVKDASLELKSAVEVLTKDIADLKSGMETLKSQFTEMNAAISKPVKKSMPESQKKDFSVEKSYPLDFLN
jgi:hypothetical protein